MHDTSTEARANGELDTSERTYDEMPYESYPITQCHPSRLAAAARLYGLKPAPLEHARILELGCASGGNLLPLAAAFPQAQFLGIDISGVQITAGRERAKELGLENIRLRKQSISDFGPDEKSFDYIIVHGVFSWVPAAVREDILRICRDHLTDSGIAYVSYNTAPGWHLKAILREALIWHTRDIAGGAAKVEAAHDFLRRWKPYAQNAYGSGVAAEIAQLEGEAAYFLRHDFLESENEAFTLQHFIDAAWKYSLGYITDADTLGTLPEGVPIETLRGVMPPSENIPSHVEQYVDFFSGRMFRMSVLCRAPGRRKPVFYALPKNIRHLHFRCMPLSLKDASGEGEALNAIFSEIDTLEDAAAGTKYPLTTHALKYVMQRSAGYPSTMTIDGILHAVSGDGAPTPEQIDEVQGLVLEMFRRRMITLYDAPVVVNSRPDFPEVESIVRSDALRKAASSVNRFHEKFTLDPDDHVLLPFCDGTRDVAALEDAVHGAMHLLRGSEAAREDAVCLVGESLALYPKLNILR